MLSYIEPKPTLIVANGEKPSIELVKHYQRQAQTLISLDGATNWLLDHNLKPDIVIGDMDSVEDAHLLGLQCVKVVDQDTNDLEKGLRYCLEQGLLKVTIIAAFGLRIDHLLTNLFVLKKFAPGMILNLVDAQQCAFICPKNREVHFDNLLGSYISLFPLSEQVGPITSFGVAYPLHREMLSLNSRIGTLNRITADSATLCCEKGDLLVVVPNY